VTQPLTTDARVRELHDRAVAELVAAHKGRTDEPLVLAVRYRQDDPVDVFLLEVLSGFPGADDDELLTTEFAPSAQLRILGKLHLALGSPAQLRAAARRDDAIIAELARGAVVHGDGSPDDTELRKLLGL
jgi:hypothetical protein